MAESREHWKNEEEEEEEEDEVDETSFVHQKDAVLFAIDVSETMLAMPLSSDNKKDEAYSPTMAALKCASEIMQQRIISNPKDMIGVLLFGTKKSRFQDDEKSRYPNCYLLNNLDVPGAQDVKTLREVLAGEDEYEDLLEPCEQPVSMSNLLFCANQIFTTSAPDFGSRRLFIITDKDDPHGTDKDARKSAAVRAKDLYDLGVIIELFPISHPDHEFDKTKFYDDIVYRDPVEGEETAITQSNFKSGGADGMSLLGALISDVNSKQVAKRALFSGLPFEIGPDFKISVKGYNLLQEQKPSRTKYVWLGGEKALLATGVSGKVADAIPVEKTEIKKAYKFGGTHVLFTPEEIKDLKKFESPVLRVIGFKPQSMLPFWACIKKSTFIYPSEEHYVGSTRVFVAFWKKLLKDKIMGLAWYIARSNASPTLVAIIPSPERLDDKTKIPVMPAGLWLYPLPFADDIRHPPTVPKPLVASDTLINDMLPIVQQLQLPKAIYDPNKYPNPALQWHFTVLQALALDDELPEKADDKTVPKVKQIDKRAGEYIHKWGVTLDEESQSLRTKRVSEEPAGPVKKRVKVEGSSLESMSHKELKSLVVSGGLGKYTIPQLKALLSANGLSVSGKKPELAERIEQWVEDR